MYPVINDNYFLQTLVEAMCTSLSQFHSAMTLHPYLNWSQLHRYGLTPWCHSLPMSAFAICAPALGFTPPPSPLTKRRTNLLCQRYIKKSMRIAVCSIHLLLMLMFYALVYFGGGLKSILKCITVS